MGFNSQTSSCCVWCWYYCVSDFHYDYFNLYGCRLCICTYLQRSYCDNVYIEYCLIILNKAEITMFTASLIINNTTFSLQSLFLQFISFTEQKQFLLKYRLTAFSNQFTVFCVFWWNVRTDFYNIFQTPSHYRMLEEAQGMIPYIF
jgi:hypothetical protein